MPRNRERIVGRAVANLDADYARAVSRTALGLADALAAGQLDPGGLDDYADGFDFTADTIDLTDSQDAYNADALDRFADDDDDLDPITGWTLQSRPDCCLTCAIMTGMVFDLSEPVNQHPRCRCNVVPVRRSSRIRAGYVPGRRVPRKQLAAKAPKSWKLPRDLSALLTVRDYGTYRPIRQVRKPGTDSGTGQQRRAIS